MENGNEESSQICNKVMHSLILKVSVLLCNLNNTLPQDHVQLQHQHLYIKVSFPAEQSEGDL